MKWPFNINAAEWSACLLSERKNAVTSVKNREATVKVKKEIFGVEEVGGNIKMEEQNPLQGKEQNAGSSSTLPDEPRLL